MSICYRAVCALLLVMSTTLSFAQSDNLLQTQLDNGLTVIVKADHRSPVVVTTVWYKVGGSYEHDGITGISHVLEHLMFQGTKRVPQGKFLKIVTDNGGRYNAVTTDDYTKYYEVLSADKLALSLRLEADRMRHLVLSQPVVAKELQVVKEERRMRVDDNPIGRAYERFMAASFTNSPYHHPVVGWQTDLDAMTLANVRDWYDKWYRPNNAAIIVVGDVVPEQVVALVKRYFSSLPQKAVPVMKPRVEVPSLGEKSIQVNIPAKTPWLVMGYHTPSLVTQTESSQAWQNYALVVASEVLAGSDSSWMSQQLVRGQQIAAAASSQYDLLTLHRGLFTVYGLPTGSHSVDALNRAITQQVQRLQTQVVTKKELARIKAQVIAAKVYQRDSIMAQADELGQYWVVGLPVELSDEFVDGVSSVLPEQVQAVAKRYLVLRNRTAAILNPTPVADKGVSS